MAAERIKRQDILYQQGRSARFVLGEAALWTRLGPLSTLVAQLDRLVALAGLTTVDLAVVPFASALPVYPLSMFKLYDADMAMVESLQGEQLLFDPELIASYGEAFDQLHDAALSGADAVTLIQRIAAELEEH
ncbi:MAG: Scr1 family TA system antitoxin-like transcriptional regulator [Sciscionella sp.]